MQISYKAIWRGGQLEWLGESPPENAVIELEGNVQGHTLSRPDKARAVQALRELAARGGVSSFGNLLEWQRETLKDRTLPGREDE